MIRIDSYEQLEEFQKEKVIVSTFVDSFYTISKVKLVLGMQRAFDSDVGSAWHMLIPYKAGVYAVDCCLDPEDYGVVLSRQIISKYGLKNPELPALIFEFVPRREYFAVSLGGKTDAEIVDIIGRLADIVTDEYRYGSSDVIEFRAAVHRRIVLELHRLKVLKVLSAISPRIASLIGAASDLKSLV